MEGELPDYQAAAWLMAAFLEGLSLAETRVLTRAMIASGEVLDLSRLGRAVLDKHSTGGVGDKVTLVLAPLVASCGAVFGKMSGRGLAHTGGTIDKLESIPGFRTTMEAEEFIALLEETGICVAGQSPRLVPADDRLYALRDVTATVDSNPLTAASIMSKKIAAGADVVVLDVKVGRGAFFHSKGQALGVAHLMRSLGEEEGIEVLPVLTAMDQPLGHAVGNALEVLEAVATLRGEGPDDLVEVVTTLAAKLLVHAGLGWDYERAAREAGERLENGAALAAFRRWIAAQGGETAFIDDPSRLTPASLGKVEVRAPTAGWVSSIDALAVGRAVHALGAGRSRKGEPVDHAVGVVIAAKTGDEVAEEDLLATVYARTREQGEAAAAAVASSYTISGEEVTPPPVVLAYQLH